MFRLDLQARLLAVVALAAGTAAAWHYHLQQLTLSHYDAKAHLVVARRIFDSLTPGWEQIGAVWLPLPHVAQALPMQVDWFYRTGAFSVAVSIVCFTVAATAVFEITRLLTGSRSAAAAGAAVFIVNPNVLYLQSTPMTEPLLFALTALEVWLLVRWVLADRLVVPGAAGWVMALACLTRYEAWPITATAWAASGYALWRQGHSLRAVSPVLLRLAAYPAAALVGFLCLSRLTIGVWFVTGGFFVPDERLLGHPGFVLERMREGAAALGGTLFVRAALVALVVVAVLGVWQRRRAALLVPLALAAAAALPFYAFVSGHPFRIRYEVPLILAGGVAIGLGIGQLRRLAPVVAILLAGFIVAEVHPLDPEAPMVREAQLDRNVEGRRQVTRCLVQGYHGETIMASMGSLAHYMQELSAAGFSLVDFLHEGNGPLWDSAYTRGPGALVGWVLVEERAEGGDALFQRQQAFPHFLDGFTRVCEGGNVALYRRTRVDAVNAGVPVAPGSDPLGDGVRPLGESSPGSDPASLTQKRMPKVP